MKTFKELVESGLKTNQFEDVVNTLNEASFNEGKLEKVAELYSKLMGKFLGTRFYKLNTEEYRNKKTGPGKGIRYMGVNGSMIRFNWDAKIAKKGNFDLTSMDYWKNNNQVLNRSSIKVVFKRELNVVQILDKIVDIFKTGKINESAEEVLEKQLQDELYESVIQMLEGRSVKQRGDWLEAQGLDRRKGAKLGDMRAAADEIGLREELEVWLNTDEENSLDSSIKKNEKNIEKPKVFADPDLVFQDIEDLTHLVAMKKWRTLIVCGLGGVGKTYHITTTLKRVLGEEGLDWTYHSGAAASPFSFYKTLYQERDKVIVFDEADSFLKNKEIVMQLKPILDTSGDNLAEYLKGTENMVGKSEAQILDYCQELDDKIADGETLGSKNAKLPSKFPFMGSMVFISNMPASEIDQAIMSRSIFVDVYLAERDILKRIHTILRLQAKAEGTSEAEVEEVMEALSGGSADTPEEPITYMTPEYARQNKQMTVRAGQLGLMMKRSGLPNWQRLAALYA